ncbi:MAG TPA: MBL fold metallo-hydrolase [Anaerovoracaceae bacterium]|nr:MBL fold metallo-hydrolase [Anaerovoracaceae bacterium]
MSLGFFSVASSSSGNSYILLNENVGIILDVGVSGKKIKNALNEYKIPYEHIKGILITHEHTDHIKSVGIVAKTFYNSKIYCSKGTEMASSRICALDENRKQIVSAGDSFYIENILIKVFVLSHDAQEPIGYSFECDNKKIVVVTDTGKVTEDIQREMIDSDMILLESNHEVAMLEVGSYPYHIKRRILSDLGHLSNETAANALCEVIKKRKKGKPLEVLLGHISSENNDYYNAKIVMTNILEENDIIIGKDVIIDIAGKDNISKLYRLSDEY